MPACRATLAGVVGDFAGHSLSRGFVTEVELNEILLDQTMAMTGHGLTKSVVRYAEVGDCLPARSRTCFSWGGSGVRSSHQIPCYYAILVATAA